MGPTSAVVEKQELAGQDGPLGSTGLQVFLKAQELEEQRLEPSELVEVSLTSEILATALQNLLELHVNTSSGNLLITHVNDTPYVEHFCATIAGQSSGTFSSVDLLFLKRNNFQSYLKCCMDNQMCKNFQITHKIFLTTVHWQNHDYKLLRTVMTTPKTLTV
eukprot:g16449.t1